MNHSSRKMVLSAFLVFLLAFLSYQFNAFRVTAQDHFEVFQMDSEMLVLDGIRHHQIVHDSDGLGYYAHGDNKFDLKTQAAARGEFERGVAIGWFKPYPSQFGLQYYFFNFIYSFSHLSARGLEAVAALLMSAVIAGIFFVLLGEVPLVAAWSFALTFILSPWVVCFAKNIYWIPALWFLPTLVTLYYGRTLARNRSFWLGALLFFAMLAKFLCGYEYLTAICLSALVPILYYCMKAGMRWKRICSEAALAAGIMFGAFVCAIALHMASLGANHIQSSQLSQQNKDKTDESALAVVLRTAEKRLYSKDPKKTAEEACVDISRDGVADPGCVGIFTQSLKSNAVKVTARYFIVPGFVPWVASSAPLSNDRKTAFDNAMHRAMVLFKSHQSGAGIREAFSLDFGLYVYILSYALSYALFLLVLLLSFYLVIRRKRRTATACLTLAFFASISWYIVAKAHSSIHTQINFVLWYLIFIPVAIMVIACEFNRTEPSIP